MADDIEELHRFAFRLGLQLSSYQGPPKTTAPHYDITGLERDRAIRLGAMPVNRRQIVEHFRRVRVPRSKLNQYRSAPIPRLGDTR